MIKTQKGTIRIIFCTQLNNYPNPEVQTKNLGVTIFTETQIMSIKENSVQLRKKDGEIFTIRVDNVIFAINAEPENSLVTALKSKIKEVLAVGDAASPGNIGTALRNATEAALNI